MPKLTVLMPVYNAEKYLREALESILEQTFADFEFLIIDDYSTDNSIDIVNSYKDNRIRLVRNVQNMGISKTLNKGIELASSDLIARMDADDISLPERLNKQYNYLQEHPDCSMVSSNVEVISENGERLYLYQRESKLFYYNLTFYCWIYHPSVMYRRQPIQDVGMYPPTLSEDFHLWSKLIRKYSFYNMQEILIKYRMTKESVSNSVYAEEYRAAAKKQIKENLRYFVGEDYIIPDGWLEAYRNNFDPLCKPPRVSEMASCISELDKITPHILKKENKNRDPEAIKIAADQKKKYLFESFLKRISTVHKAQLMMRTGNYWQFSKFLFLWTNGKIKRLINLH
ncbi:hypothetical protein BH23BAC3_BH23BAC3_32640 [soil metagenome]